VLHREFAEEEFGGHEDHDEAGATDTIFALRGPESPQALPQEDIGARESREEAASIHSVKVSRASQEVRAHSSDRQRVGDCPGCWRPGHRSHRTDVATVDAQQTANAKPEKAAATVASETKKIVATTARKPVVESAKSPASAANAPAAESATTTPDVESASTAKADVEKSALVTISGCLEFDDATFWLKDTDGVDAPKSRSWKSGFLRKRSAPIEVVETVHTLRLPTYVGHRVAATGTLIDREIQVRSLQRIADSCN
jgi:hypothetical protein